MDLRRAAVLTATAAIGVHFTISGNLLTDLGGAYISDGGWLIEKIHPGSYLAIAAGALRLAHDATCTARRHSALAPERALFVFLGGIGFCALQALLLTGPGGVIALLDSFLPAGCLALALSRTTQAEQAALRRLLQSLLVVNALIAVAEAALQTHLVPIVTDGESETEFRPTALYDHPLTGATASMIGLFLRPDPRRAPLASVAYLAVLMASLLAFGERMPLAAALVIGMAAYARTVADKALCRKALAPSLLTAAAAIAATAGMAAAAAGAGLGTRLAAHLYWDPSAQVRLNAFAIIGQLQPAQLFAGISRADLTALIEPMRLETGAAVIENFWLVLALTLGAVGFPVFVAAMAALVRWLWQAGAGPSRLMILALMVTASTSNSLGRKSMLLLALVAAVAAAAPPRKALA